MRIVLQCLHLRQLPYRTNTFQQGASLPWMIMHKCDQVANSTRRLAVGRGPFTPWPWNMGQPVTLVCHFFLFFSKTLGPRPEQKVQGVLRGQLLKSLFSTILGSSSLSKKQNIESESPHFFPHQLEVLLLEPQACLQPTGLRCRSHHPENLLLWEEVVAWNSYPEI